MSEYLVHRLVAGKKVLEPVVTVGQVVAHWEMLPEVGRDLTKAEILRRLGGLVQHADLSRVLQ